MEKVELGERFTRAFKLAMRYHGDLERKGSGVPYMGHILGVTSLVIDAGGTEDEAIAALLHDGPEDAGGLTALDEIGREFGGEVKAVVDALSDTFEVPKPPWKGRKEAYIQRLRELPEGGRRDSILLVSAADKLHNLRSILADFRAEGDAVWARFSAPEPKRESTLWYYASLNRIYAEGLGPDHPLARQLGSVFSELERVSSSDS